MVSKLSRGALFFLVALCITLGSSMASATAQAPAHDAGLVGIQGKASAGTAVSSIAPVIIYSQPPSGALLLYPSSQLGYNQYGSDFDRYVWENFTISFTRTVTQIDWRGGYSSGGYYGGGVVDFIVSIYPSIASGAEPNHLNPPLVQYTLGGIAGETPAWVYGSPSMSLHDYSFVLPAPFTAIAGTKYWLQIEGIQNGPADWGWVAGTGGDNSHFYAVPGIGDFTFGIAGGDVAFSLLALPAAHQIYLPNLIR